MALSAPIEAAIEMANLPPRLQPTKEEIERKPWKYIGYRGYAKIISSDNDFLIFRRFDTLSTRVALALQDEVAMVKEELDNLDTSHSKPDSEDVNNGSLRDDLPSRARLLDLAAEKLQTYNDFLLQQASLRKLPLAPQRDITSLQNWHYNHANAAISVEEQTYLDNPDLIRVVHEERTPLRQVIDSSVRLRTFSIWRSKSTTLGEDSESPETSPGYQQTIAKVSYYSDKRINAFASSVIVFIGVNMLIAPIWILQALENLQMKLGVITIFISVFLLLVSFAMVAKPFEALGATAAYAPVLMVFIQFGTET